MKAKFLALLFMGTLLISLVGCTKSEPTTVFGALEEGHYRNTVLGFEFDAPKDWILQPAATTTAASFTVFETTSEQNTGATVSYIKITAEEITDANETPEAIINKKVAVLKEANPGAAFTDVAPSPLGGIDTKAAFASIDIDKITLNQSYFCFKTDTYFVHIDISTTSDFLPVSTDFLNSFKSMK